MVQLPENDELSWSKKQLLARMDVAMGGRVAEELVFGADNITGGAGSDLESATKIARAMVTKFGMTEAVSATYCKLGRRWLFCCLEVSILPTTTDQFMLCSFMYVVILVECVTVCLFIITCMQLNYQG